MNYVGKPPTVGRTVASCRRLVPVGRSLLGGFWGVAPGPSSSRSGQLGRRGTALATRSRRSYESTFSVTTEQVALCDSIAPETAALLKGARPIINTVNPDGTFSAHRVEAFTSEHQPGRICLLSASSLFAALNLRPDSRLILVCVDGVSLIAKAEHLLVQEAGDVGGRVLFNEDHDERSYPIKVLKETVAALPSELLADPARGVDVYAASPLGQPVGQRVCTLNKRNYCWRLVDGIHAWVRSQGGEVGDYLQLGYAVLGAPAGAAAAGGAPEEVITVRLLRAGDSSSADPDVA